MKQLSFSYEYSCLISRENIIQLSQKILLQIEQVRYALSQKYKSEFASLYVPQDKHMLLNIQKVCEEKRKLSIDILIVIGIGGSSLGARAIHEALHGILYNEKNPSVLIYFLETVDTDFTTNLIALVEHAICNNKQVLINVITKSGTTTETIINFELFLSLLKKYYSHNYSERIVVTTGKTSPLWEYASREGFVTLEIPEQVGGRYSVFTAVGLFPLMMLDVNIPLLLEGAYAAVNQGLNNSVFENFSMLNALIKYAHYLDGLHVHDLFVFDISLKACGEWYRQLIAESLGKSYKVGDTEVFVGILPTVSVGSIDLHSVAQLYLGGPRVRHTTFIGIEHMHHVIALPNIQYDTLQVHNKNMHDIMNALLLGAQKAYRKKELPFCTILLPEKKPFYIGYLLQNFMLEVIYLGYLFGVNPFDQPHIELYKKETRKALEHV